MESNVYVSMETKAQKNKTGVLSEQPRAKSTYRNNANDTFIRAFRRQEGGAAPHIPQWCKAFEKHDAFEKT